jgi:outer membrane protein TolC
MGPPMRRRVAIALLLVTSLAVSSSARADGVVSVPDAQAMTLPEALAYAHEHQPSLASARARLEAVQRDASAVRAEWLPRFSGVAELMGSTANNSTTTQLTGGPAGGIDVLRIGATKVNPTEQLDWKPYGSTLVGVGVRQEVFDFGRIAAQASAVEALGELEKARSEATVLTVEFAVTEAYYAVLAARNVLSASEEAYARAKVHRDFAEAAVRSGVRPPIELTRAEADSTRFDVGRIRARAGVRVARSVLAAAVGAPRAEIDAKPAQGPGDGDQLPTPEQVEGRVLSSSPILRMGEAAVRAQHAQTTAIGAQMRPNLLFSAAFTSRAGGAPPSSGAVPWGDGFVPVIPNYGFGVVLSWPLWDPTIRGRVAASEAREEATRADLAAARTATVHAAQQELQRVEMAHDAVQALERALAAAKANAEQAEARFTAGLGTSTELADAEGVRVEAEIALAAGRFQWMTARAALARAMAEEP